jgi:hypothetical protein
MASAPMMTASSAVSRLRQWTTCCCNVSSHGKYGSNLFDVADGRNWRRVQAAALRRGGLQACSSALMQSLRLSRPSCGVGHLEPEKQ